MSQRNFLNLTHDPFAPPREGFYPGADRKTPLEQLQKIREWSRRVMLVTGAFGIGKSTLFRELSNTVDAKAKAARLSGLVATGERDVLVGLIHGFGIAASAEATSQKMADLVVEYVLGQEARERLCVCMVDDAHLLDTRSVNRLIQLVLTSPMRLVMFAEPAFVPTLARAVEKHAVAWFEYRLSGYPKRDARQYLEWRFDQAEYRGLLPFTDEQVHDITTRSAGNPGKIDSLASELLMRLQTGDIKKPEAAFPGLHVVLAGLIACGVALIYALAQPKEQTLQEQPLTEQTEVPPIAYAVDATKPEPRELEISPALSKTKVASRETARVDRQSEKESGLALGIDAAQTARPGVSEAGKVRRSTPKSPRQESLPPNIGSIEVDSQAGAPTPRLATQLETEATPVDEERTFAQVLDNSPPAPLQSKRGGPNARRSVETTDVAKSVALTPVPNLSNINSSRWILRQDPQSYTLQLVTYSSRDRAESLVNRQADPEEFAIYHVIRDQRLLYVVIYGVFSSAGAAQRVADQLPGELGSVAAWVRQLDLVQDTVRSTATTDVLAQSDRG